MSDRLRKAVLDYRTKNPNEPINPLFVAAKKEISLADIGKETGISNQDLESILEKGAEYEPDETDEEGNEQYYKICKFVYGKGLVSHLREINDMIYEDDK